MKLIPLFFLLASTCAYSGTILQEQTFGAGIFRAPEFKGQTFTAIEPILQTIGVHVEPWNTSSDIRTVRMSLFAGRGTNGTLLFERTANTRTADYKWMTFDVSGVAVVPGETYSFIIQEWSAFWGASYNQWSYDDGSTDELLEGLVDYPGGEMFTHIGFYPYLDMTFKVDSVPEPNTTLLLLAGFVGLCLIWRVRARAAASALQHHH